MDEVLVVAAVAAGVTGAWSPCGFSMVETLAPSGYAGRLRTTVVACAMFAVGALAGGVITFGGLSLLGDALGANAPVAAAVVALAAALGEARGLRIVPQVRRQVPESWRRVLPVPLAAGLYGVLLGLGFTTFILSFAVWALAAISVTLGDPALGVAIGLAFGAGRALPVIALAPRNGGALHAAMAERPRILRSLRAFDALTLALAALVLATAPAQGWTGNPARIAVGGLADPSVDGDFVALHRPGGAGELRNPALPTWTLPGSHPAIGGGRLAYVAGASVVVHDLVTLPAPGANAVAVSATWVAWRAGDLLTAASLDPAGGFVAQPVVQGAVGRPVLAGSLLIFEIDGRIEALELTTGVRSVLRREPRAELRGPSVNGARLTYVRATYKRQQVLTGTVTPRDVKRDRVIYGTVPTARRDEGHEAGRFPAEGHINKRLWDRPERGLSTTLTTTATRPGTAYVTRLRQRGAGAPLADILRIDF